VIPLPWTPRWYGAGISLWALAARIAFVSTAAILTVLEYLVGATKTHRAPIWFGSLGTIARVGQELQLPAQWSAASFCSPGALPLIEREHYCLALRWCPQCLSSWYHSPHFQDTRVLECPVHKVALLERCPHCSRAVDPLAMRPWSCPECRQSLAQSPEDWRYDFVELSAPVLQARRADVPWRRSDAGASVWIARGSAHDAGLDAYETDMGVYEYMSVLWECFAGEHRQCAQHEHSAAMGQYSSFEFQCPVAAAFLQAGLAMGVEPEPRGLWPAYRRYHVGWRADYSLPGWARPQLAREQLRLFVLSALLKLTSASRGGWSEAIWVREHAALVKTTTTSRGLFLSELASDDDLLKACRLAAESCRRLQASNPGAFQSHF
jgi:hypothetical protein